MGNIPFMLRYLSTNGMLPIIEVIMPNAAKYGLLSVEDYRESERDREIRHEYVNGEIYAMAQPTELHNIGARID